MKTGPIDPAELDAYDAWVAEHLDEMVRQHPGKVIAVYQGRLIAVGDTYRDVFEAAKAKGITEEAFTMRVPTADGDRAFVPQRNMAAEGVLLWNNPCGIHRGMSATLEGSEAAILDRVFRP